MHTHPSPTESSIEPKNGCLAATLQVLGDKWTGLILRDLITGPQRFTALQSSVDGISPRTLSQRLDSLELHGIITKQSFNETPPRVEYTLTTKGMDFIPVLKSMATWGDKYFEDSPLPACD